MCIKYSYTLKFALKRFCLRTLKGDIIISTILEVPLYLADNTGKVSTCISAAYSSHNVLKSPVHAWSLSLKCHQYKGYQVLQS